MNKVRQGEVVILNCTFILNFLKTFPKLFLSAQCNGGSIGVERHSCPLKLFTNTAVSVAALYTSKTDTSYQVVQTSAVPGDKKRNFLLNKIIVYLCSVFDSVITY